MILHRFSSISWMILPNWWYPITSPGRRIPNVGPTACNGAGSVFQGSAGNSSWEGLVPNHRSIADMLSIPSVQYWLVLYLHKIDDVIVLTMLTAVISCHQYGWWWWYLLSIAVYVQSPNHIPSWSDEIIFSHHVFKSLLDAFANGYVLWCFVVLQILIWW